MDESEIITSEGNGVWGGTRYELRLITSSRAYSDSLHQAAKTVLRFVLEFWLEVASRQTLVQVG
jgi:hypothetical protein